ncbi:MAG: 4'-phosphopantetheinyl transferase superfamily protein [Pseudomonadales bacterium]|nr:4'-phosphopantetheinyl transferase superfamily protein [Pseudomonadales bacterium]
MLKLADTEIHLWHVDQAEFEGTELEDDCLSWLTEIETTRYLRYTFDHHRKQFLLGRMLIRNTLSKYATIAPEDWLFTENDYGKPAIDASQQSQPIFFNLSHSGDRLVLALSKQEAIGVDIESSNKPRRVLKIADRYFSPSEVQELLALPDSEQLSRFYDLWTLKEAYIKACGLGLAIPLQQFSYAFPSEYRVLIDFAEERNDDSTQWQVWQIDPGRPFKLALAVKSGANRVEKIVSRRFLALDEAISMDTNILRDG